jgi:hypothetical protein
MGSRRIIPCSVRRGTVTLPNEKRTVRFPRVRDIRHGARKRDRGLAPSDHRGPQWHQRVSPLKLRRPRRRGISPNEAVRADVEQARHLDAVAKLITQRL